MTNSRWVVAGLLTASWAAAAPPSSEPDANGNAGAPAVEAPIAGDPSALEQAARRQPLVIARDPAPPEPDRRQWRPPPSGWRAGVAGGVAFGAAFVEGVDAGYFARVEAGAYDIQTRRRGLIGGMLAGVEGWRAKGPKDEVHFGGSLPLVLYGGLQSDAFFAVLGGGLDLLLFDRVEQDTGVGFLAPEAAANLGLDLEGVRFLLDARAGYHWQLGADDRSTVRLGLAVHLTTD